MTQTILANLSRENAEEKIKALSLEARELKSRDDLTQAQKNDRLSQIHSVILLLKDAHSKHVGTDVSTKKEVSVKYSSVDIGETPLEKIQEITTEIVVVDAEGFGSKPMRSFTFDKRDAEGKKTGERGTGHLHGRLLVQLPPGVVTTGMFYRFGSKKEDWVLIKDIDAATLNCVPVRRKEGFIKSEGTGLWVLEAMSWDDGPVMCGFPTRKSKTDGKYYSDVWITNRFQALDPAYCGKGAPVVQEVNACLTAIANMFKGTHTIHDGSPGVWPDGGVKVQSCVTCVNFKRMYPDHEGHMFLSLSDYTISDKKRTGKDANSSSVCCMTLTNPMLDAENVRNEWAFRDKEDVNAIIGHKRLEVVDATTGEKRYEYELDEYGNRIPIYGYGAVGGATYRYPYGGKIVNWTGLLYDVGTKMGGSCPYYRFSGPSGRIPGLWHRDSWNIEHKIAAFTERIPKGASIPSWSIGLPGDGHGINAEYTGRVMFNTGHGIYITIIPELFEVVRDLKTVKSKVENNFVKPTPYDIQGREREQFISDVLGIFSEYIFSNIVKSTDELLVDLVPMVEDMPAAHHKELAIALDDATKARDFLVQVADNIVKGSILPDKGVEAVYECVEKLHPVFRDKMYALFTSLCG